MYGRLTVDRVFIVLPVMAYSVGLERPFPTGPALTDASERNTEKSKLKPPTASTYVSLFLLFFVQYHMMVRGPATITTDCIFTKKKSPEPQKKRLVIRRKKTDSDRTTTMQAIKPTGLGSLLLCPL